MQTKPTDFDAASTAASEIERSAHSHKLTGRFRYHNNFQSHHLDHNRNIIVYLPPHYDRPHNDQEEGRHYPVLYLNDGQNLFDSATAFNGVEWGVDETAERLINSGRIEPLIIVGIYNTGEHRIEEYTPTVDPKLKKGGKADQYGRFIVEDLKPFIDRHYRTMPEPADTGLGGASLGGLVSLYLGLKYPQVFGKLMVMSPAVWWDRRMILRIVKSLRSKPAIRLWLDMGTKEGGSTLDHVRLLKNRLLEQGWQLDADLKYLEAEGGLHTEADWGARVEPALKFLFPK